jgi:cell fate regulator YaaT (PSP1 superfamily)
MPNSMPEISASPTAYLVRHGTMRFLGSFDLPPELTWKRGDEVIIKSDRGIEHGYALCPATPAVMKTIPEPTQGVILRIVTPEDRKRLADVIDIQKKQYTRTAELIREHRLNMQLVDVEHLFGGERIVFYFMSETRVDFRELVKSMAREFKARIELRQIGVRDEAKLLADYGDCGKPVCCNTHMAVMPPVSMRMAKLQKSTLDPNKISGRCGRLKCCLRFEQDVYEEHLDQLPAVGSRVVTSKGQGKVLAQEVLAKRLLIEFEDGRRLPVTLAEVLTRL